MNKGLGLKNRFSQKRKTRRFLGQIVYVVFGLCSVSLTLAGLESVVSLVNRDAPWIADAGLHACFAIASYLFGWMARWIICGRKSTVVNYFFQKTVHRPVRKNRDYPNVRQRR